MKATLNAKAVIESRGQKNVEATLHTIVAIESRGKDVDPTSTKDSFDNYEILIPSKVS